MKSITVYFEDKEFKKLIKSKDTMTWHDFILTLVKEENSIKPKK